MNVKKAIKLLDEGKCGCCISNKNIEKWYRKLHKLTGDKTIKEELDDFITPTTGRIGFQEFISYKTGCCLKNLKQRLIQLQEAKEK